MIIYNSCICDTNANKDPNLIKSGAFYNTDYNVDVYSYNGNQYLVFTSGTGGITVINKTLEDAQLKKLKEK